MKRNQLYTEVFNPASALILWFVAMLHGAYVLMPWLAPDVFVAIPKLLFLIGMVTFLIVTVFLSSAFVRQNNRWPNADGWQLDWLSWVVVIGACTVVGFVILLATGAWAEVLGSSNPSTQIIVTTILGILFSAGPLCAMLVLYQWFYHYCRMPRSRHVVIVKDEDDMYRIKDTTGKTLVDPVRMLFSPEPAKAHRFPFEYAAKDYATTRGLLVLSWLYWD